MRGEGSWAGGKGGRDCRFSGGGVGGGSGEDCIVGEGVAGEWGGMGWGGCGVPLSSHFLEPNHGFLDTIIHLISFIIYISTSHIRLPPVHHQPSGHREGSSQYGGVGGWAKIGNKQTRKSPWQVGQVGQEPLAHNDTPFGKWDPAIWQVGISDAYTNIPSVAAWRAHRLESPKR